MAAWAPPKPRSGTSKGLSPWRRRLAILVAPLLVIVPALSVPAIVVGGQWWDEGLVLVDQHRRYEVAHPGWSFPGRVYTQAVPVDENPSVQQGKRLVVEAKARGYVEDCKEPGPGEFCAKTGEIVPRSGGSLEPIELGWLIGPDGELREHLPLAEAPQHLIDAIIAAEDRDFRGHHGVNFRATLRAVWANAQQGGYAQGASTLTMQLVKNLDQKKEKTLTRKAREAVMALAADHTLGKDGVLQMYLDAPYLGQRGSLSICGFRAAAKHYFGKDAAELTLSEAATLAGILPAPGRYAPDKNLERAQSRRDLVLHAMAEAFDYDITAALDEPILTVEPEPLPERYPVWLSAARAFLEAQLPPETVYGAGLTVVVGMDVLIQEETDRLMPAKLDYFSGLIGRRKGRSLQSAGVMIEHETGRIVALYGGDDVTPTSFNRATQARRQPGSSFKPLVYALAFSQPPGEDGKPRFTAASTEPNEPRTFKTPQGDWRPRNTGGEYSPTAALAQGLAWSQNIATAALLEELGGPAKLIPFAAQFGIDSSKFPEELGLALGQGEVTVLEMTRFASAIGNGGFKVEGSPVVSVTDPSGVARLQPPGKGDPVLSPEAAALTRELMRLVIETGTGGAARGAGGEGGYQGVAAGKTGTTDGDKDLWFVGATPRYAAALWLGFDVPESLGWAASDLAAPLWGWWMNRATRLDTPLPEFPTEPAIERRWICRITGKSGGATCPTIGAPFIPGTQPKGSCGVVHPPPEDKTVIGPDGVERPKHESLWKKMAREKAEAEAAAGGAAPAAP